MEKCMKSMLEATPLKKEISRGSDIAPRGELDENIGTVSEFVFLQRSAIGVAQVKKT